MGQSHLRPCMRDEDIEKIPRLKLAQGCSSHLCEDDKQDTTGRYLWAPPEWENERQYVFDDSADGLTSPVPKDHKAEPTLTDAERKAEEYLRRNQHHLFESELPSGGSVEDSSLKAADEAKATAAANESKLAEEAKQKVERKAIEEAKAKADAEDVEAKAIEEAKANAAAEEFKAEQKAKTTKSIEEAKAKADAEEFNAKQKAEVQAIEEAKAQADAAKADAEELEAKAAENLLGPLAKPGAAVMVMLDNGSWVLAGSDEQSQIKHHLSAGETKFPMVSRGAMYMMDFTNMEAPTQTNAHTKKARTLKISSE